LTRKRLIDPPIDPPMAGLMRPTESSDRPIVQWALRQTPHAGKYFNI
jgi:hypothetical protein